MSEWLICNFAAGCGRNDEFRIQRGRSEGFDDTKWASNYTGVLFKVNLLLQIQHFKWRVTYNSEVIDFSYSKTELRYWNYSRDTKSIFEVENDVKYPLDFDFRIIGKVERNATIDLELLVGRTETRSCKIIGINFSGKLKFEIKFWDCKVVFSNSSLLEVTY